MKRGYKLFLLLLLSSLGFGAVAPNCTISIKSKKKNGETLSIVFHTKLRNQNECKTLAKMHRKNFTPDTIQSKQVSFVWNGSSMTKKRSGMVARVSKKSLRRKNNF